MGILTTTAPAPRPQLIDTATLKAMESKTTVFHVTDESNVPSIVCGGLVASIGSRSAIAEHEKGVYCFNDVDSMLLHVGHERGWYMRSGGYDGQHIVVFAVDVTGLERWERPTMEWEWATRHSISASRVKKIGRLF